jgi:hypothetical protein
VKRELAEIRDGYDACCGLSHSGWYAGVQVIDDIDSAFLSEEERPYDEARESSHNWEQAVRSLNRRVLLVTGEEGDAREIARADLVCGPESPKERSKGPVLTWTQRRLGSWELKLHSDGKAKTVLGSREVLRGPKVAICADGLFLACERDDGKGRGEVLLLSSEGRQLMSVEGRNPILAASAEGLLLMTERCSRNSVKLRIQEIIGNKEVRRAEIDGGDDYTFNADLAYDTRTGDVFVVSESCPAFGMDDRIGMHRDLKAWRWRPDSSLEDITGATGRIPIERVAFNFWSTENMPPIRPKVYPKGERIEVVYRQFRYAGFKSFGWDVFTTSWSGGKWSRPVRVTEDRITPDTGYGVAPSGDRYLGVFPCVDNPGGSSRSQNFRVKIVEFDEEWKLPAISIPEDKRDGYFVTTGFEEIAPSPPELDEPYRGRSLVWGDMHAHTVYSKCVSAMDGSPDEIFRYQRDVLGCQVFTFTDHGTMLGGPEATWLSDRLEILAGGSGVALFSTEPSISPGRHTNWYSVSRKRFDQLRCIIESQRSQRQRIYRQVMEDMPPASVIPLRHFHGKLLDDGKLVQSFEPRLEVAMEAMQGRTNALMGPSGKFPAFPNQFLDAGFKIGLVGGSDHYRGRGPNHYCLTGFWVKELSPEGVMEALRNRYTIAMSDSKIALTARLDGQPAGQPVTVGSEAGVKIRISVSCGYRVIRATLIRDGEILPWVDVMSNSATLELVDDSPSPGLHWYVPTVEVETAYGGGNVGYGHSSPFFVMVD